jgi:hypothetical protein
VWQSGEDSTHGVADPEPDALLDREPVDADALLDAVPVLDTEPDVPPDALLEPLLEVDPPSLSPATLAKSVVPQCTTAAPAMKANAAKPMREPSVMEVPRYVAGYRARAPLRQPDPSGFPHFDDTRPLRRQRARTPVFARNDASDRRLSRPRVPAEKPACRKA